MGIFIYLIKINVNLPQLLGFVVLAAVNGEYRRFEGLRSRLPESKHRSQNVQNADIRHSQPLGRQNPTTEVSLRLF